MIGKSLMEKEERNMKILSKALVLSFAIFRSFTFKNIVTLLDKVLAPAR